MDNRRSPNERRKRGMLGRRYWFEQNADSPALFRRILPIDEKFIFLQPRIPVELAVR